jgi:hypothetical protein
VTNDSTGAVAAPNDLVKRFKRNVAPLARSKFVQLLLEQALPPDEVSDDDPLYQAALGVEQDEVLTAEMAEWDAATSRDGLASEPSQKANGCRLQGRR